VGLIIEWRSCRWKKAEPELAADLVKNGADGSPAGGALLWRGLDQVMRARPPGLTAPGARTTRLTCVARGWDISKT